MFCSIAEYISNIWNNTGSRHFFAINAGKKTTRIGLVCEQKELFQTQSQFQTQFQFCDRPKLLFLYPMHFRPATTQN